jgi:hypothetical protein
MKFYEVDSVSQLPFNYVFKIDTIESFYFIAEQHKVIEMLLLY